MRYPVMLIACVLLMTACAAKNQPLPACQLPALATGTLEPMRRPDLLQEWESIRNGSTMPSMTQPATLPEANPVSGSLNAFTN